MTDTTPTLGARIKAMLEDEKLHPLEAARQRAYRMGRMVDFDRIVLMYNRFKLHAEQAVDSGVLPPPLRLERVEEQAIHFRTDPLEPARTCMSYFLWLELQKWATEQQVTVQWKKQHDGGGIDSWMELSLVVPKV
jgi:hypothetical protein